jgi:hypothetical protein
MNLTTCRLPPSDVLQSCACLQVLGNLRLPNAAFKADRCPEPVTKLMTVLK